jgi:hypothetical protein
VVKRGQGELDLKPAVKAPPSEPAAAEPVALAQDEEEEVLIDQLLYDKDDTGWMEPFIREALIFHALDVLEDPDFAEDKELRHCAEQILELLDPKHEWRQRAA